MKKRTVGFLLAIVFALTALSGLTSGLAVADDGLVACFDFDNGLVSNGFTASLCGGAKVKEGGRSGKYAKLDSSASSYLSLPSQLFDGLSETSISLWLHLDGVPFNWARLLEIGTYNSVGLPYKYMSVMYNGNGKLALTATSSTSSAQNSVESSQNVALGGWAHLLVTVSARQYNVYLNGTRVISANMGVEFGNLIAENVFIGKSLFASDPYLAASVDDVKVYSRALDETEISKAAGVTDAQAIERDIAQVDFGTEVTFTKLNLFTQGNNGTTVRWTSSNTDLVDEKGYVFADVVDRTVKLTARFSRGTQTEIKEYNIMIKAKTSNVYATNTAPQDVELLDGIFAEARDLNKQYLLSLQTDRLLVNYRKTCGIATDAQEYGGWITEANGGSGNTMGHYLTALTNLYAEQKDALVLEKLQTILAELRLCQQSWTTLHPDSAGYWGGVPASHIADMENGIRRFVPYYVVEKNLWGAYNAYVTLGNQDAKQLLLGLADYVSNRVNAYSDATMTQVFSVEYGGMPGIMFALYSLTGNKNYLVTAQRFCEPSVFDAIDNDEDPFVYKHANTAIPKIYGVALGYVATGDERYLEQAVKGFEYLTVGKTFCTGNISEVEELHPAHETDSEGFQSAETCCAYNLMRLCDVMYRITGEKSYADYYEKLLYNCILASMDPETGMKTYYVSMDSGYYKVYHTPETSFWCCTGTGLENFTKFNQTIYYKTPSSLTVNLFVPSSYVDDATGLGVKMTTNMPDDEIVSLEITQAATTTLRIRDPYWSNGTQLFVNGKEVAVERDGNGYVVISRSFAVGDVIQLVFPMTFRLDRLDSTTQPHSDAIMYGPLVMCGVIDSIGDVSPIQSNSLTGKMEGDINENLFYQNNLFDGIVKTGSLTFDLVAQNQTVSIKPFFRCHRERYVIYWNVCESNSQQQTEIISEQNAKKSYLIDTIDCGNWFSESPHNMQNNGSWIGNYATEHNRGLVLGGWFSYDVRVEKGVQNTLEVTHFGTDGGYSYALHVNDTKIADVNVTSCGKKFYCKSFEIPQQFSATQDVVSVKVVCTAGTLTTGIYTISTYRAGLPLAKTANLNVAAAQETSIALDGLLCDKFVVSGSGKIKLYGVLGNKRQLLPQNEQGVSAMLGQYSSLLVKAEQDFSGTVEVYGDKVTSIDSHNYVTTSPKGAAMPNLYATVRTQNGGTFRMAVDWSNVQLCGNVSGVAPVFNMTDVVAYTVTCKKLSDGLLAYYNFDELVDGKVADASGNGNDGIVVGRVREAKGYVDGGLNLGGLDGCVQLPNIRGLRAFTVSMWVKFNSSEDVAYQRIFDFGNDRHNYFTFAACGYVGGATNGNVATVAEKVYDFTPGKWYHYAVTVCDGVVTSYLNGVELSRNENFTFDLAALDGFVNNAIGRASINYSPYLNGVVDEFRLYNYALSAEQVKGLYRLVDVEQEYFE